MEWKPGELVEAYNAIDALETFLVEWKHPQHVAARYTAMHLETFLVEWKRLGWSRNACWDFTLKPS